MDYNSMKSTHWYWDLLAQVDYELTEQTDGTYLVTKKPEDSKVDDTEVVTSALGFSKEHGSTLVYKQNGFCDIYNFDCNNQVPTNLGKHDGSLHQDLGSIPNRPNIDPTMLTRNPPPTEE